MKFGGCWETKEWKVGCHDKRMPTHFHIHIHKQQMRMKAIEFTRKHTLRLSCQHFKWKKRMWPSTLPTYWAMILCIQQFFWWTYSQDERSNWKILIPIIFWLGFNWCTLSWLAYRIICTYCICYTPWVKILNQWCENLYRWNENNGS